jgi:hypothetical protein
MPPHPYFAPHAQAPATDPDNPVPALQTVWVDKLLPGYFFFFFSCLASFFSLAVFCGFFFSDFLASSDLDMGLPSLV